MNTETEYEELSAKAARGELTIEPGSVRDGDAAAHAEIQRRFMEATGAATADEAAQIAVGRPRLGAAKGQSPVVRARVPQALKEGVTMLAQREHRAESEIIRDAVAAYLETRLVS